MSLASRQETPIDPAASVLEAGVRLGAVTFYGLSSAARRFEPLLILSYQGISILEDAGQENKRRHDRGSVSL
jgi:hypothetical protein